MVKKLLLGLLAATVCGFVIAAPFAAPPLTDPTHHTNGRLADHISLPLEDPAARSERSTNLSHVTGTARKIQMFIKNRHLQILPDGTVNGTTDDTSPYTILQRMTVGIGQMKIQGIATCQYLCMDGCGLLYGSKEFGDECIFSETIEQNNYNTYSSNKYSNERRTFYLALNRRGQPRKVVIKAHHPLGKLASYTRVLTRSVSPDLHPVRHHGHLCTGLVSHQTHAQQTHDPPRCPKKRKKKKKKKRKCLSEDDDSELCQTKRQSGNRGSPNKCDENKDSDECQRFLTTTKRPKLKVSEKANVSEKKGNKKKKKNNKNAGVRKRLDQVEHSQELTSTTQPPISTTPMEEMMDEDYGIDTSTHSDWEESTGMPDISMAISEAKPSTPSD